MKKLNPEAIKVLFYQLVVQNLALYIPILILFVIFISANYLLHIFVISIVLLFTIIGSWLWAKKIINNVFQYEITPLGLKVCSNWVLQTNEIILYNQILDIFVYQNYFDRQLNVYRLNINTTSRKHLLINNVKGLVINIPLIKLFYGFSKEEAEALRNEILGAKQNMKENIQERQNVLIENRIQIIGGHQKIKYFLYGFSILCIVLAIISGIFLREKGGTFFLVIYIPGALLFAILGFFSKKI